eukprot:UN01918
MAADPAYRPSEFKIPKKPKDDNAPKRGMTAFLLFAADIRQETRENNPEAKIGEISKIMGAQWQKLSAAKKKKYTDKANKEMAAYKKKMEKHKESHQYKKHKKDLAEWNDEWKEEAAQQKIDKENAKKKQKKNKKK